MTVLALLLLGAYAALGLLAAGLLAHRGVAPGTAAAAVVGWPFFVHTLVPTEAPPRPAPSACAGPLHADIDLTFDRLEDAARRVEVNVQGLVELTALRRALHVADTRVAVVDRILAEDDAPGSGQLAESLVRLRARRDRSVREIRDVLDEIARLRVQLGMLALSGDTMSLQDGIRALVARVKALDEVDGVEVSA